MNSADSFDKGYSMQTYSGYENKVKKIFLQRAQTYNMLKISCAEIPTQTVQVEKIKTREIGKKIASRVTEAAHENEPRLASLLSRR